MGKYFTKYEFRWAFIILLLSLLWTAFEYEMKWHDLNFHHHRNFTFLFILPFSLCYWFFFLDKRGNRYKKRFSFKHAFNSGMALTVLVAIFTVPTQFIIHYFLSPDYLLEAKKYSIEAGELTKVEANKLYTITNFVILFPILYMLLGIFLSIVFGNILQKGKRKRRQK